MACFVHRTTQTLIGYPIFPVGEGGKVTTKRVGVVWWESLYTRARFWSPNPVRKS